MSADILLTIVATSIIQSIFGAGVLLFGTPLLLLLGYNFIDALVILLPISLIINAMQIGQHRAYIDLDFYRKILWLTLPPIAVFLFMVTHSRVNIGLLIGAFLLFIALKEFSAEIARTIGSLMKYEKAYFVLMGVIHGLSNLGGSLLTAVVHYKGYPKDKARVTVAASYATFAAVQLATLFAFNREQIDIPFSINIVYMIVACMVYTLANEMLYLQISQSKYQRMFSIFLAMSGILLIGKSL